MKIWQQIKKDFPLLLIIASTFVIGWYVYPDLPQRVPSHWNFQGEIDGYSSRFWGAFGLPLMILGCFFLFELLPFIDPRKENYAKFTKAYTMFKYAFTLLFYGLYIVILLAAMDYPIKINIVVPVGIAILFIVIGNYLTTVRHNYFIGIRTPWTLASEEVWRKTHRLAGRLWFGSGLVAIIALLLNAKIGRTIFFVLIIGTAVFSMIYSWWCFQKLNNG
ncbi:MAG: SdpI family protein [Bacillota bacterium]|jgi:uncharacterized membrane protein|nr:SdpI family protein [Clostridia bacterium]